MVKGENGAGNQHHAAFGGISAKFYGASKELRGETINAEHFLGFFTLGKLIW